MGHSPNEYTGDLEEIDPPPSYELKYDNPWKIIAVKTNKEIPTGETYELYDKAGTVVDVAEVTEWTPVIEWRYYDMNGQRKTPGDYRKWGIENQKLHQFDWQYGWLPDGTKYYTFRGDAEVPQEQIYQDRYSREYVIGYIRFGTKGEALDFRDTLPDNSTFEKPYYTKYGGPERLPSDIPKNKWLPGEPFIPNGYELGNDDIWRSPYTQEALFESPYARRPLFTGMDPLREDAPRTRLGTSYLGAPQSIVTGRGEYVSGAPQVLGTNPYWGASQTPRFVSPVGTMKSIQKDHPAMIGQTEYHNLWVLEEEMRHKQRLAGTEVMDLKLPAPNTIKGKMRPYNWYDFADEGFIREITPFEDATVGRGKTYWYERLRCQVKADYWNKKLGLKETPRKLSLKARIRIWLGAKPAGSWIKRAGLPAMAETDLVPQWSKEYKKYADKRLERVIAFRDAGIFDETERILIEANKEKKVASKPSTSRKHVEGDEVAEPKPRTKPTTPKAKPGRKPTKAISPIKPRTQPVLPPAQAGRYGFNYPVTAPVPTRYGDYEHLVRYLAGEEQRRRRMLASPALSEVPPTRPGLTGAPPARMPATIQEPYAAGRIGPYGRTLEGERQWADMLDVREAEAEKRYEWYKKQAIGLLEEKDFKEYFREEIPKELEEMSYKELRAEAKARGLKSSGKGITKDKLIKAIKEHMIKRDLTRTDYKKLDRLMSIAMKEKGLENVALETFEESDWTRDERGRKVHYRPGDLSRTREDIKPTSYDKSLERERIAEQEYKFREQPKPKRKLPYTSLSRDVRRIGRALETDKALRLFRQGLSPWEVAGELGIDRPPPNIERGPLRGRFSRFPPLKFRGGQPSLHAPPYSFTMTPETHPQYFPERRGRLGRGGKPIPWSKRDFRMPVEAKVKPYDMFAAPAEVTVSTNMDVIVETTPTEPELELVEKLPAVTEQILERELNDYADGKLTREITVEGKKTTLRGPWALRWNANFFTESGTPFKTTQEYKSWRAQKYIQFKKLRAGLAQTIDPGMAEMEAYKQIFTEKIDMRRYNYYTTFFDDEAQYERYAKLAKENKLEVMEKEKFVQFIDEGHERLSTDHQARKVRPTTEARRFERIVGRPMGEKALAEAEARGSALARARPKLPKATTPAATPSPTKQIKVRPATAGVIERAKKLVQRRPTLQTQKPRTPYSPFQSRQRAPLGRFQAPVETGVAWAAQTRPGRALGWLMSEGTMRRPGGARGILAPLSGGYAAPELMGLRPGDPGYRTAALGGGMAGYAAPMQTFGAAIGQHEYAPFFEWAGLNERQAELAGAGAGVASMFNPVTAGVTFAKPIVTPVVERVMAPWMARNVPQSWQRWIPRRGIY